MSKPMNIGIKQQEPLWSILSEPTSRFTFTLDFYHKECFSITVSVAVMKGNVLS